MGEILGIDQNAQDPLMVRERSEWDAEKRKKVQLGRAWERGRMPRREIRKLIIYPYPLLEKETFLLAISCNQNKLILKKHIPEHLIVKEFLRISNESNILQYNHILN